MGRNCINFHVSKELGVVLIEVVVDDKPVYCLLYVLGVHDELLQAYRRSLRNAAGKRDWSRAGAWSCESMCASSVIRPEPVKFKVLDTESFGQYLQQYAMISGVEYTVLRSSSTRADTKPVSVERTMSLWTIVTAVSVEWCYQ